MLKGIFKILTILFATGISIFGYTQNASSTSSLAVFTDRDFCTSGDTIWFKIISINGFYNEGNVVHVQLVSSGDNLISKAIKKSKNGWVDGYLHVPDSLSTGVYFISAFLNSQRSIPALKIQNRSLFVYNRFEDEITELNVPCKNQVQLPDNYNDKINIQTDKNIFSPREKVLVKLDFNLPEEELSEVIVRAAAVDALAKETGGIFLTEMKTSERTNSFAEKDGFLIKGTVIDSAGEAQSDVVVGLSITEEIPYFDYYYTNSRGEFYFFLKNAEGLATIYLQPISEEPEKYSIRIEENYLPKKENICFEYRIITKNQADFISDAIDGRYFSKLFQENYVVQNVDFKMPSRFDEPFYGEPKNHIIPDEYIPLNDFQEIARELLPGVQYRNRKGEISIRLLNYDRNFFFEENPLRLINGIPVFENKLFSTFKSSDIQYIDYVLTERLYGDMIFSGVLSVNLNDKSNSWQIQQPQIQRYNVECIQFEKRPEYQIFTSKVDNIPDIRNVFLWNCLKTEKSQKLEFYLSDVTGKVEISVRGVTKTNTMIEASKIIEVK